MALRRYQHKFLQPLEIDQSNAKTLFGANLSATSFTASSANITTAVISNVTTANFFNSAALDYNRTVESLLVYGNPGVSQGQILHIRNNNVSVNDADVFGGIKISSSPGADFIIGKSTQSGTGFLQVRRENGTTLWSMNGNGDIITQGSILSTSSNSFAPYYSIRNTNTDTSGGYLTFEKYPTDNSLTAGDDIGTIQWKGADTSGTGREAARIETNVVSQGSNFVSGSLDFYTTNSSGTPTLGMTLTNAGNLAFQSGKGIDFSATANSSGTMTSELLDDYETGTWTPTLLAAGGAPTGISYSVQTGSYTKIGNMVYVSFRMTFTFTNGTGSGSIRISGLPFTAANIIQPKTTPQQDNITYTGFTYLDMSAEGNNTWIVLGKNRSGGSANGVQISDCNSGGTDISGGVFYRV